jgi:hypothetical protein
MNNYFYYDLTPNLLFFYVKKKSIAIFFIS